MEYMADKFYSVSQKYSISYNKETVKWSEILVAGCVRRTVLLFLQNILGTVYV